MIDLLPPPELTPEAAGLQLLAWQAICDRGLVVADRGVGEADRAFYDSFDGRLFHAGLCAIHEHGTLALTERDSGSQRAAITLPRPARPLLACELEPGAMRDALGDVLGVRALLPLARVQGHVYWLDVLDSEGRIVVRMALEEPAVLWDGSTCTALRPRLILIGVRGCDEELHMVRGALQEDLAYRCAAESLVDEAVVRSGGSPGGASKKVAVPLHCAQRSDAAAGAVLRALLDRIEANMEGTVDDVDSEFLHDLRVAVRRTRATQRQLKDVFPTQQLGHFRSEFRWLQRATSEARDLDVCLFQFDAMRSVVPEQYRDDLDPLLEVLRTRRVHVRKQLVLDLGSHRTRRLLARWSEFLDGLEEMPAVERPDAARAIDDVIDRRIAKVYRRMRKLGRGITPSSPATDYHELRKMGKELRYLLELFGASLHPWAVVGPMIKGLKSLQEALGRHRDREVQIATLLELREDLAMMSGGAAALVAMGMLIERLVEDEQTARQEFAQRFAEFASRHQRRVVKKTFA